MTVRDSMTHHNRSTTTHRPVRRRRFLQSVALTGTAGAAAVAGCLGDDDDDEPDPDEPIVIGAIQPYSGPFAPWGAAHQAGLEFAIDEVNDDGGVLDREIEIEDADTGSDPGEGETIFRRFVEEDNAVAIVGPVDSDLGIRTAETAEEMEVPLFLHMSGTHAALTTDSRYTYRVGLPPAPTNARAIAELIEELGYTSVAAIVADYAWGRAVETSLGEFSPDGVDVGIDVFPVTEDDFTPGLRDLPDDIEAFIAKGHPPGSNSIAVQMNELGISPELTTGGYFPPDVLVSAQGQDVIESVNTTHLHLTDVQSDEYQDLAERYYEATDERMTTYKAYGYVTGKLIAQAIEDADSTAPVDVSDAVRDISFDTVFRNPIEYTEWGELDNIVHLYSQFEFEAPDFYPDGDWRLEEFYATSSLPAYNPDEFPLD